MSYTGLQAPIIQLTKLSFTMKLSLHTDYSLRVLLLLGANRTRRLTLQEIAAYYDISHEHLRKVVHLLATEGYVNTFRGKHGGIELKRAPEQVNIGELVETTEPRKAVIDCQSQPCVLLANCSLQGVLRQAEQAFYQTLKRHTLADLLTDSVMQRDLIIASSGDH